MTRKFGVILLLLISLTSCQEVKPKAKSGQIMVFSEPISGAQISLDGVLTKKQTTALFKKISPGLHRLDLTKSNPINPKLPWRGSAKVKVKAGETVRVTVGLSLMAILPQKDLENLPVRAETNGQKIILDFYQALNEKNYQTAYSLLSRNLKKSYRSYQNFLKTWQKLETAEVIKIKLKKTINPKQEINHIGLKIKYKPLPRWMRVKNTTTTTTPSPQFFDITSLSETATPDFWVIDQIIPSY